MWRIHLCFVADGVQGKFLSFFLFYLKLLLRYGFIHPCLSFAHLTVVSVEDSHQDYVGAENARNEDKLTAVLRGAALFKGNLSYV